MNVTQAEADRILRDGGGVLFRDGVLDRSLYLGPDRVDPPVEFVEAAAPCETCMGSQLKIDASLAGFPGVGPCPDCHDGKRRIAVTVETFDPHPYSEQSGRARLSRRRRVGEELILREMSGQWFTGRLVTVGHVVVEWGPLVVVDVSPREGGHVVLRRMWAGTHWDYRLIRLDHGVWQELTLPPDIDPATLVGQYALGGKVVTP